MAHPLNTMTNPVIIFCHGAWHSPTCWSKVTSLLESSGYTCNALSLPGVGSIPAVESLEPDITCIRDSVVSILEKGQDVVVVAHSWAGIPVSSALEGLGREEREREGKKNGVVKLVYISSFVLPKGVSLVDIIGGEMPEWWGVNGDLAYVQDAVKHFYHDVEPKEAAECVASLRPQSLVTFTDKVTGTAWMRIPSVYMILEDDKAIPVAAQESMVKDCQEAGALMETERIPGAHSPFLTKPDVVADFLRRAVNEGLMNQ